MKNKIIFLAFLIAFIISLVKEPISEAVDAIAGVTTPTYSTSLDATAGASNEHDDDDEDDD
jgi:hypothetical protein